MSLSRRLIAAILALVAAVCATIGVVTTVLMREQLVEQLDHQLLQAGERFAGAPRRDDMPRNDIVHEDLFPPGQAAGTVSARIVGGTVAQSGMLDSESGSARDLTGAQIATLAAVPVDANAYTIDLGGIGAYRAVAQQEPDGEVRVTALPLSGMENAVWALILVEVGVASAALLLAGLAGLLIVRFSLRPLRRMAAAATRVTELPLDRGEVDLAVRVPDADTDPRTEVGQVGAALNRMLRHVGEALAIRHASEMRARQFVADASHELRTPLAAIRGYAELTRRRRDPVPPEVAHALGRIESESVRMTTIVDDLLLLARLDSGRPLACEPVDLSQLMVDTVSDAQAAGQDRKWLLDLPDDAVTVPGDRARLHQVLTNLLANCRTHTPSGTAITASLTTADGCAVISVVDNGPGIPDDLQPEVFQRFARGNISRSRAAGSTGLGLAIVAAVVDAHRGEVEVKSRPGWTSFVVTLPGASAIPDDNGRV